MSGGVVVGTGRIGVYGRELVAVKIERCGGGRGKVMGGEACL